MPKSKELIESEDDLSSSEEKQVKKKMKVEKKNGKTAAAAAATKRKNESESENEEEKEEVSKSNKKTANSKKKAESESSDSPGDGMYMLAKQRFVNVSEFKGKCYVNIREYYEADGEMKPGKKGISLSTDQWENLKKYIANIDADLKKSK